MANDSLNYFKDLLQSGQVSILLICLAVYCVTYMRRDSFVLTLTLALLLNMIHFGFEYFCVEFLFGVEEYKDLTIHLWYSFFSLTDFAFVAVAIYAHDRLMIRTSQISRYIMAGFIILGLCQVLRYLDRTVLSTKYFSDAYSLMVPTIDTSITLVVAAYTIFAIVIKLRKGVNSND